MKQSKFRQALFFCLFLLSVSFISCNGNDAKKAPDTKTDSVVKPAPNVIDTGKAVKDSGTIDTTKTEQNPPVIRHPN